MPNGPSTATGSSIICNRDCLQPLVAVECGDGPPLGVVDVLELWFEVFGIEAGALREQGYCYRERERQGARDDREL